MDAERWRLIEKIFDEALHQDPVGRRDFLSRACGGDLELVQEVEQLLAHHAAAGTRDFLNARVRPAGDQLPSDDPYIGKALGPHRIRRRVASGGMGNVYLAVRQTDFRQQVAIKILRRGMDSEDILRRFRNEIQVLAALSKHAHIAALLDAGTTDDGLPFFVMEYVDGLPLDAYCDQHKLNIRERIELFCRVCEAVHFAHQHMIIHRDLKMNNILVRSDGAPKLIDFGIAKLTTPELGAQTMTPTSPERRFMTAEYASPEQARGDSLTAASDVYSLGVVLYELLAGAKPYTLSDRPVQDHVKIICEYEPQPPSKAQERTSKSGSSPAVDAARDTVSLRNTTPAKLRRQLTGDLDNIVMKALRKDPRHRYSSADDLYDDLQAFLDGSPVLARPIGKSERIYRWCRRNPVPAVLFLAVLTTLGAGLWHFSRLSDQLVESTAVAGAGFEAETLAIVQDYYSKVVVERVKDKIPVTHRYAIIDGAIPVPASFTIDLGEHIRKSQVTGMLTRMYSDFPFRHREGGGVKDDFERTALRQLTEHADKPFYRFENYGGRRSLRYATARVMQQDCVNCHNAHPDSTKKDWKVGEIRGVLEIIRPLDADVARTQRHLRETFYFLVGFSALLVALGLFFLRTGRNR